MPAMRHLRLRKGLAARETGLVTTEREAGSKAGVTLFLKLARRRRHFIPGACAVKQKRRRRRRGLKISDYTFFVSQYRLKQCKINKPCQIKLIMQLIVASGMSHAVLEVIVTARK